MPGGRLLFATCSIFKAEGSAVIDAFLQRHGAGEARLDPRSPGHLLPLPDNRPVPGAAFDDPGRAPPAILPADGFHYALIHKT